MNGVTSFVQVSTYANVIALCERKFTTYLQESINRKSSFPVLKGVGFGGQFTDTSLHRYFEHALAYADFKDASKSENKHRLYLGFFNGPLYPEAVFIQFKERLVDRIRKLCSDMGLLYGMDCPGMGDLPRPIQEDALAEVIRLL